MKKKKCDLIKNHIQIYYLFENKPIKNKLFFLKSVILNTILNIVEFFDLKS